MAQLKLHRCPHTDPVREAEDLLARSCGIDRAFFLAHPENAVLTAKLNRFRDLIARRRRHEPLAHILGSAFFFGRKFKVSRDTLIPRPATETIVEAALAATRLDGDAAVIDVGTGSGAIAVTLAAELPDRKIMATDSSGQTLVIARKNARRLGMSSRVRFMRGDLAAPALKYSEKKRWKDEKMKRIDANRFPSFPLSFFPSSPTPLLVIANLPYIPTADWRKLPPDIRKFEPRAALDGGRDGLDPYRRLLRQLAGRTQPTIIIMEILPKQRRTLETFCRGKFPGCRTSAIRNLAGIVVGLEIAKI